MPSAATTCWGGSSPASASVNRKPSLPSIAADSSAQWASSSRIKAARPFRICRCAPRVQPLNLDRYPRISSGLRLLACSLRTGLDLFKASIKPCGKPPLSPAHKPLTKLGVNPPVGNLPFHPQLISSLPSGSLQERHSLIIGCTSAMARATACYPQKGLALYINIKNKLYKKSLFLFFISSQAKKPSRTCERP